MHEAQLYEKVGRLQMVVDGLDAEYTRLLGVLAQVVAGELDTIRLLVDLTNRRWELAPPGQRPPRPATINGLPLVVTAPDEALALAALVKNRLATLAANGEQLP